LYSTGVGTKLPVSSRSIPAQNGAITRSSRGLEEFFGHIHGLSGLTLLDLGGATQQNVSFITDLGHRLYSENFLQILKETSGAEGLADQSNPGLIDYFLRQSLDYPDGHFDGVLIWEASKHYLYARTTADNRITPSITGGQRKLLCDICFHTSTRPLPRKPPAPPPCPKPLAPWPKPSKP